MSEDRDVIILRREGNSWAEVSRTAENEVERIPLGFASDNKRVLFSVSKDGAPAGVFLVDPETGKETLLSRNQNVDVNGYVDSSDGMELLAISYLDGLLDYDFIKPDHPESKVYAGLINAFPNHAVSFQGASKDGRYILFTAYSDVDPGSYYLFDRQTAKAKFLLSARSWIKPGEMSPMKPIYFAARDGKKIHGYLTLPLGSDGKNLPMVLFIHGGPTSRDVWGFDRDAQFLASRGYAVLQVNFRGSTGYGGDFTKRGDKHWGTTMIDDMTDAVDWAIRQGIADKNRICTYGASYGGYGALQSVARNPEKYQCAIGYVGVYSLPLMFKDGDIKDSSFGVGQLRRQLPNTLAEQQAQSPAYNIDKIKIPVMLVHGAEDKRVPISHYELLKGRLTEAGRPPEVTVIEKKEGHGFYDLDNNINLYTRMEAFLNKHIGERASEATAGN
jgi:dipeptidyl aminopeptidase/acylaminoacyl peptidase